MAAEPRASAREVPTVSVLLPAWNEAAMLGRCLDSLLAIDWPGLEIVVCAGGSDGTLEIARSYAGPRVTVLEQHPGEGKQVALRRCFAASHGEIIYLTDADCIVPEEAFRAVITPLVDGEADAATGDSHPPYTAATKRALIEYQYYVDRVGVSRLSEYTVGIHGRNAVVRRSALERAGGFCWTAPTGTDYALAEELQRVGFRIRHVPNAEVISEYPTSLRAYVRQRSRWLRNLILLGRRYHRWSLFGPAVASSAVLAAVGCAPLLALGQSRRRVALSFVPISLLAFKRAGDVIRQELDDEFRRPRLIVVAALLTPVEIWIRARSLAQVCVPSLRWRW